MKKFGKLFLIGAIALGFVACNNENEPNPPTAGEGTTYMNLSITFPKSTGTKASSENNKQENYNPAGTYAGNDKINTVDVYVFSGMGIEFTARYNTMDDYQVGTDGTITPKVAIKTTAGPKTVYVVINDVATELRSELLNTESALDIAGLAKWEDNKDVIMMTGMTTAAIEDGVTEEQTLGEGGKNRVLVNVTRLASKAVVTTSLTGEKYPVGTEDKIIGQLSNVNYAVGQGEKQVRAFPITPEYKSFGYDFVPEVSEDPESETPAEGAQKYYDYSSLKDKNPFDVVSEESKYTGVKGAFLFENTHEWGVPENPYAGGYRKGNTAYILVRGKFTPNKEVIADKGELNADGTFYVGASDGRIYTSVEAAQAAVMNQKVREYKEGKVLYYAWLNPDKTGPDSPFNSPVIRNNVYHVNVTGFKNIGINWNPLNPDSENPDKKPDQKNEPETPPVDPTDPIGKTETHMSVDIKVLPWTVHKYDIDLEF